VSDTDKLARIAAALQTIDKHHSLVDAVYYVRDFARGEDEDYTGSSWDHSWVKEYIAAVEVLQSEGVIAVGE
jgi:hypothetical protein